MKITTREEAIEQVLLLAQQHAIDVGSNSEGTLFDIIADFDSIDLAEFAVTLDEELDDRYELILDEILDAADHDDVVIVEELAAISRGNRAEFDEAVNRIADVFLAHINKGR